MGVRRGLELGRFELGAGCGRLRLRPTSSSARAAPAALAPVRPARVGSDDGGGALRRCAATAISAGIGASEAVCTGAVRKKRSLPAAAGSDRLSPGRHLRRHAWLRSRSASGRRAPGRRRRRSRRDAAGSRRVSPSSRLSPRRSVRRTAARQPDVGADEFAHVRVTLRTPSGHPARRRRCSGRRDEPMSRD